MWFLGERKEYEKAKAKFGTNYLLKNFINIKRKSKVGWNSDGTEYGYTCKC